VIDKPITDSDVPTQRDKSEVKTIKANHGSFDNNLEVVNTAIARILGRKNPKVAITDLRGF
jgi:hypothetical protein